MSSTANSVDADIQAAFAGKTPEPMSAHVDEDIRSAFAPSTGTPNAGESPTLWERYKGFQEGQLAGATGGVAGLAGGLSYLGDRILGKSDDEAQANKAKVQSDLTYVPRTQEGRKNAAAMSDAASYLGEKEGQAAGGATTDFLTRHGASPEVAGAAGSAAETLANVPQYVAPLAIERGLRGRVPAAAETTQAAQEIVDRSSAGQSMGAASATHDVQAISPELQQAVVEAARKTGGAVNPAVLKAHIEAEEHGVQLMKGQATRDPEQFTEEQNSTHPDVVGRINAQNGQMTDALDTVRRDASPTTVGNDYIENGRAAVDALKQYDEPIQADIRGKYKALIDANGGSVPIDTGKFLSNVDTALKKGFLTKTAASSPEVSEILDSVRSGEPMDFEAYENARTRLASAQRAGGSAGEAARIVRGELEQMPLSPAASKLKGLADTARSAAKSRFDALEADPAYQAAVDDVSAGNKKGSPTPLADTFLDKYALSKSAPKSQVDLMMQKIKATDPDAAGAVASHALNAVRKAAISPNGSVLPNGYNGALQKLGPKLDSLIEPETKDSLESLGRVITNAKVEPAGGKVNYSRSGIVARDAIQSAAEGLANAKTGGLYGVAKKILNTSENSFAKDALRPGAGLEQLTEKP